MTGYAICTCIAYTLICIISGFLVLHRDYEDGLIGRVALSIMSFVGLVRVGQIMIEGYAPPSPSGVIFVCAVALFLSRHCYRFLRWRRCGDYQWRAARK